MLTSNDILPRLEQVKQTSANTWNARCPAHDDQNPSLSIKQDGEDLLLYCHRGCSFEQIIKALPVSNVNNSNQGSRNNKPNNASRRIVSTYNYEDENGRLLFQKVRYEPKGFAIRCPNGNGWLWSKGDVNPVLYKLPQITQLASQSEIFIVEGEKDADRLVGLGLIATCNFDGASQSNQRPKWKPDLYNRYFRDHRVYILPDNDDAGRAHADYIASTLFDTASQVNIINLPGLGDGGDVSDWLDQGHTKESLLSLCYETNAVRTQKTTGQTPEIVRDQVEDSGVVPPLPETAVIPPEVGADACQWLDHYIEFSQLMSPRGYGGFHEAAALWLLSTIAARRIVLRMGGKTFSPSLYISFCAHTTLYAKSTTARVAQDVLDASGFTHLLLPSDTTPQAMIAQMSDRIAFNYSSMTPSERDIEKCRLLFPSQRGWFYDEFGTKIKSMMNDRGVMADFRGLLRVLDDNRPYYEYVNLTRRDRLENPYLALLANMTPADIKPYAKKGSALWHDGFFARFAFITPPQDEPLGKGRFLNREVNIPQNIIEPLKNWHKRLGIPKVTIHDALNKDGDSTGHYKLERDHIKQHSCNLKPDAESAFYNYHDSLICIAKEQSLIGNDDFIGNYGRFAEKALRIAILLASLENNDCIEINHWAKAQTITEHWRENLHNLAEQVNGSTPSEERTRQDKILDVLQRHGPQTASRISQYIRGMSGPEVDDLCKRLVKTDSLEIRELTQRKTNIYAIPIQ